MPVGAEFFVALFQPFGDRQREDFFEMFEQMLFQVCRRRVRIGVRAAERFGHDFVHEFEFEQILGGDFERGGGLGGVRRGPSTKSPRNLPG